MMSNELIRRTQSIPVLWPAQNVTNKLFATGNWNNTSDSSAPATSGSVLSIKTELT